MFTERLIQSESTVVEAPRRAAGLERPGAALKGIATMLTDDKDTKPKTQTQGVVVAADLSESEAIAREVRALGFIFSRKLQHELETTAKAYHVSGFKVAAIIARASRKVRGKPRLMPKSDRWIVSVVERALADELAASRMATAE